MDVNSSHTYSYNLTVWGFGDDIPSESSSSSSFGGAYTNHTIDFAETDLAAPLNVTFVSSDGLVEDDTWTILISSCGANASLPTGASATLTSEHGTAEVRQLTLDRGYEGTVPGSHEVYLVNQHFTVRAAGQRSCASRLNQEVFSVFKTHV